MINCIENNKLPTAYFQVCTWPILAIFSRLPILAIIMIIIKWRICLNCAKNTTTTVRSKVSRRPKPFPPENLHCLLVASYLGGGRLWLFIFIRAYSFIHRVRAWKDAVSRCGAHAQQIFATTYTILPPSPQSSLPWSMIIVGRNHDYQYLDTSGVTEGHRNQYGVSKQKLL